MHWDSCHVSELAPLLAEKSLGAALIKGQVEMTREREERKIEG